MQCLQCFLKPNGTGCRFVALLLSLLVFGASCSQSIVLIRPPYLEKLRPGDGVKITDTDGTMHSGRILYVDRSVIVIRTPKQIVSESPVEKARFATTIEWTDVKHVRVAGLLDSKGRLISNEEVRVNRRTNDRRNFAINVGLLGTAASFLLGIGIQSGISPSGTDLTKNNHNAGRAAFWTTLAVGSAASAYLGYLLGDRSDRRRAIARIERRRNLSVQAKLDSLFSQDRTISSVSPPQ